MKRFAPVSIESSSIWCVIVANIVLPFVVTLRMPEISSTDLFREVFSVAPRLPLLLQA